MMRSLLGVVAICAAFAGQPLSGGATEGVSVSFDFRNVPLREVLGHFRTAHGYDVTLGTHEWAEESVSAFIRNAPVRVALRRALKCFNYTLFVDDNGNEKLYIAGRVQNRAIDGCAKAVVAPEAHGNDDDWFESDGPDGVVERALADPGTDLPGAGGFPQPGLIDSQGREWVERDGPDGVVELVLVDPGTDLPSDIRPIE